MSDKKEAIKNWLKDKHNLSFIGILIIAIIIRLYYLSLTSTQALWWDEADYLAYAKNLAGLPMDWVVTAKHNSLYPFLVALFFKIGASEVIAKFFLQILPSILSVVLVYYLANEMYENKGVGLISAAIMSVFWVNLFNATRFHVDVLALFTGLLAVYVFWAGYEKRKKIFGRINPQWAIPLAGFLVILTYTIRRGYFIFGLFILVYMLFTRKFSELAKDKYNWIALVLVLVLFFSAENIIFNSKISSVSEGYYHQENPINFLPFTVFNAFFSQIGSSFGLIFLILFWAGFALVLVNLLLSLGHLKNASLKNRADIFNSLAIIITLALFIFVLRTPGTFGEARWYLPLAFSTFIFISRSTLWAVDNSKKYNPKIVVILIVIVIALGAYTQLKYSDTTIKSSLKSFDAIRKAGLFLKEASNEQDIIIAVPVTQTSYYSERKTILPRNLLGINDTNNVSFEPVLEKIKENPNIKYLIVSFSEPNHPDWMQKATSATKTDGEVITVTWEIPFMDTKINFINGEQNILKTKSYGEVTFDLIAIRDEVFIYRITRT